MRKMALLPILLSLLVVAFPIIAGKTVARATEKDKELTNSYSLMEPYQETINNALKTHFEATEQFAKTFIANGCASPQFSINITVKGGQLTLTSRLVGCTAHPN